MNTWVISDTHFGHSEVLGHARRPADVDARIVRAWKRLVKPTDLIIHLGDVAFTNVFRSAASLRVLIDDLPGRKVLVRGNHDSWSISKYMDSGFDFACDAMVFSSVYFTHKPSPRMPRGCRFNLHGHLHMRYPEGVQWNPNCRLFCLERTNYEPRLLKKFS